MRSSAGQTHKNTVNMLAIWNNLFTTKQDSQSPSNELLTIVDYLLLNYVLKYRLRNTLKMQSHRSC